MTSRIAQLTLDVYDVQRMAEFWSQVLGYEIEMGDDGNAKLYPSDGVSMTMWLQRTDADKVGKNRDHPDLNVTDTDVAKELDRLLALGASPTDVGQTGDEGFTVLQDPEGNEFCLLHRPVSRP